MADPVESHLESKVPNVLIDLPEGKKVAILGRPNAGKSTFINQIINCSCLNNTVQEGLNIFPFFGLPGARCAGPTQELRDSSCVLGNKCINGYCKSPN